MLLTRRPLVRPAVAAHPVSLPAAAQNGRGITSWEKVDAKNRGDVENTGMTFVELRRIEPCAGITPTSCRMKTP